MTTIKIYQTEGLSKRRRREKKKKKDQLGPFV